ncbi:outer membrane beta-barrel protein [Mucilaginibacter sp.]|uniref:outer membrane beta-barrel protein n=1 Tax=Mucilaginibacter sp. TaxID=1882438 RepID=UPI0025DE4562|nr:outer membrane beta-barrel protein [Mucilaginibacter sp.]
MHIRLLFLCVVGLLLSCTTARAQPNVYTGFIGGYSSSIINNVDGIIISEPYFINGINYRLTNKHVPGFDLGGFISYELNQEADDVANFFIDFEVRYSGNGTELNFSNSQDYFYKMKFNYQYANSALIVTGKYNRIFAGLGGQFGLNTAPHNIVYTSSGKGKLDAFGTDIEQQQQLRNVLYGKSNFGLIGRLGLRIIPQLDIEARYNYGLKNIIEVQPNSYNFIQKQNHANSVELLVKYYLNRD